MAFMKRLFVFSFLRSLARLYPRIQDVRERDEEISHLKQALERSRSGANIMARSIQDELRPIRKRIEEGYLGIINHLRKEVEANRQSLDTRQAEMEILQRRFEQCMLAATTDPLTKLYNRRGAESAFHRLLSLFERQGGVHELSVLIFDLNHFKEVNDRHGHQAGDVALAVVAEHLKRTFRAEDIIVRNGGDEFKAYLINATGEGAVGRAKKLAKDMHADERLRFDEIQVTVSIGISHGRFSSRRGGLQIIETLEKLADTAMYEAKKESRELSGIVVAPDAVSSDTVLDGL